MSRFTSDPRLVQIWWNPDDLLFEFAFNHRLYERPSRIVSVPLDELKTWVGEHYSARVQREVGRHYHASLTT